MDRGIRLETTSSYDQNKYESLGVVNAAMSVTVSFTESAPKSSGFFGTPSKPVAVDKQQKLTSTENQMLQALKKQIIMNAPPGTERLVDFKISPPENIAHSPEYILSMLASATAIRKSAIDQTQAQAQPQVPQVPQAQVQMSQPLALPQAPQLQMSQPLALPQVPQAPQVPQVPQVPQAPQIQMSPPLEQVQMSQPLGLSQVPPVQPQPLAAQQLGGKKRNKKRTSKKRHSKKKTLKHRY